MKSATLGAPWRVLLQRPTEPRRAPWVWLLHGSTSSADEMRPLLSRVADAITAGALPAMVLAVPDAPDGYRSSWWVDSSYRPSAGDPVATGDLVPRPGLPLETALLDDVLPFVESRYGPPTGPGERSIGGISMGGAAALRWALVRPDLFGSAALLSPAVYEGSPARDSSARATGAFGVGAQVYEPERFLEVMHFPTLLAARESGTARTRVVIMVGDQEPAQSDESGPCDLDLGAARLHAALRRRPDIDSSLRVVGGGHDWPFWEANVVGALQLCLR